MLNDIKKLKEIFNISGVSNFNLLFVLIFINSFFELISVGMLIPYLSLILDPTTYERYYNLAQNINFIIIDELFLLEKKNFLLILTFFIFVLYILKFLINILFSYYLSYSKIKYEKKVSITVMNSFVNSNNFSYLNFPVSKIFQDITNRVSSISTCVMNFGNLLAELIIFTSIILFIIFSSTEKNFFIFLILLLIFTIFFLFFKKKAAKWSNLRGAGGNARNKNLLDFLEGIREIIIYSSYKNLISDFKYNNNKYLDPLQKMMFWGSVPRIFLELIIILYFLILLLYYIFLDLNYKDLILTSSILLVMLLRLLPSINRILYNYAQIKYATEPISSVYNIIKMRINKIKGDKLKFENQIDLNNVSFNYSVNSEILDSLKLIIKKNKKIGICGETGSGKTTLIDIIVGIKTPSKGKIKIDEEELTVNNLKNWIQNIAYVPQRVFLFNSSLRNNITFAQDEDSIDTKKFSDILKFVELDQLIEKKDKKEFFTLQEFGKIVSGGQRQKIGIARALYSDRPLIILDETTNSLDNDSEQRIVSKIKNIKDKTIIFITHNIKNLDGFDQILKIESKKLIQLK
jgi:ABC-type multidrug transport system fused ATPase/permease subunit